MTDDSSGPLNTKDIYHEDVQMRQRSISIPLISSLLSKKNQAQNFLDKINKQPIFTCQ
jgi:hypothetical protein